MPVSELELFQDRARSDWVRLRTLVTLRWIAIAGQVAALFVASEIFRLQIEIGLVALAVGASVIANLFSTFLFPQSTRLTVTQATLMLLFDLLQLGLLLYLTGGLNNPFSILMLVPVTIAATFLPLRSTALIGGVSILLVTALSRFFFPIVLPGGAEIGLPNLFLFGFWVAMMIGVTFLGLYARQVTSEMHSMGDALLATQMALSREQKLTDLGGVVAAAAHELGTPLATIKLASSELLSEAADREDLIEDIRLIGEQADRCRDILRSMGRAGKDDQMLRRAPLEGIVLEAAEPHAHRGKSLSFAVSSHTEHPKRQPVIERRPEIVHGLRNLIQNAVDFAESAVEIEVHWDAETISLRISDDGPGYPPSLIGRIGDPFVRNRKAEETGGERPGYEGMGLGLFIAKTLLERSGARLEFSNGMGRVTGRRQVGAIIFVEWPRDAIDPARDRAHGPLGENPQII